MLTYTGLRNRYGDLTNTLAANLTQGDIWINENLRQIQRQFEFDFDEATNSATTTVAGTQFYNLPFDYKKLIDVTVTVGTFNYTPREVTSRTAWDKLNLAGSVKSNLPEWYFIYNGQIGFWPTPSASGNAINFNYKKRIRDLSIPDYTTGTITTATNGSTAIVGSGNTWTAGMVGRYFRIDESSGGDGEWYKIAGFTDATHITLGANYNGTSISAGTSTYTIGQVPLLPEDYHMMPVYWAAAEYWRANGNNLEKAQAFESKYAVLLDELRRDRGNKTTNPVAESGGNVEIINPNLTLTL